MATRADRTYRVLVFDFLTYGGFVLDRVMSCS